MTITVIGHLCVDEVHPQTEKKNGNGARKDFGGIFFSLLTLANLAGPKDTIRPVFGVGDKEFDQIKKRLEEYPCVDTDGIFRLKGNTNRVHHFIEDDGSTRTECAENISEPIPFARIKPLLDADGIFINMVSGFDITLDTLDSIRMAVRDARTPIHFDFHSLTLGIDPESKRFRRPLTDWRRWCFMLNSIQLTEEEALGLTAEHYDEQTLINHTMPLMVNALVITRGSHGATGVLQVNKKLTRHDVAGTSFGTAIDPLGSGDVFGAAFLFQYLRQKDYRTALEFANQLAGKKVTLQGSVGLVEAVRALDGVAVTH